MQYIAFTHCNNDSDTNSEDWDRFFELAGKSGVFCGGSAMGRRYTLGKKTVPDITENVGGYMRFETEAFGELTALLNTTPQSCTVAPLRSVNRPRRVEKGPCF